MEVIQRIDSIAHNNDPRFKCLSDREKYYCPMCKDCGICCVDRDWSTEWAGKKVGICGHLNMQEGRCGSDRHKSIICRTYVCNDFKAWIKKVAFIVHRSCPTASRLVQESILRKYDNFHKEELALLQDLMNGEVDTKEFLK